VISLLYKIKHEKIFERKREKILEKGAFDEFFNSTFIGVVVMKMTKDISKIFSI